MREVEIRWIDERQNERIFITPLTMSINNWHSMQQAVEEVNRLFGDEVVEIENIEFVAF